jgi:hypothetical protein
MEQGFYDIENEMARQRNQLESVKGKATPYRVEFRFKGSVQWVYFATVEEAQNAPDTLRCRYSVWGNPYTEYPSSRQIQVRGARGGWNKYKGATK